MQVKLFQFEFLNYVNDIFMIIELFYIFLNILSEKIITIVQRVTTIFHIIICNYKTYNLPPSYIQLKHFVQKWDKRHGIININAAIIKVHNKSWAAFGSQMTSRWSSVENHLEVIWQPMAS